mgnify:CR=1 FL=1
MSIKQDKILICVTGGGTGGHVEPLRAVIDVLNKHHAQIFWIGGANSVEERAAGDMGIKFVGVRVGKLRRYFALDNIIDIINVVFGYLQCLVTLIRRRPDVLFSKAGYVSVPAILAAATLRIPVVAHESDTVIGLANHIAQIVAKRFCTGFAMPFYGEKYNNKMVFTGNPVRSETETKSDLKLPDGKPVLAILGGSQGSKVLNKVIWELLPRLLKKYVVVHQVGPLNTSEAKLHYAKLLKSEKIGYIWTGYYNRPGMARLLTKANLVISRAGANAIADLSYYATPAVLIPLPSASANHQLINAQYVVERGGAVMLSQADASPNRLYDLIEHLLSRRSGLESMSRDIAKINPKNAAERVAKEVLEVAKGEK